MKDKKKKSGLIDLLCWIFIIYLVFKIVIPTISDDSNSDVDNKAYKDGIFTIIASTSTKKMDDELIKYGKKKGIKVKIEHYGDLEIVDKLNSEAEKYDAVWISNSIWLYMLDNTNLVTDSKSIVVNPVVMGVVKSKAKELNFVDKDITNTDILNAIKNGKLKYVMASVTKTNTGASSYLNFLNSLAGRPQVLTEEILTQDSLKADLKAFFMGVERVSGDEEYLTEMFKNGEYDAIVNYESSLIELNQELTKKGKEPLYLLYPTDGVAINDMPFAYINNNASDTANRDDFLKLQGYLRSEDAIKKMAEYGYRSWYGGINTKADKKIFNPDWGIDTTKYLADMKYPSKKVISKALSIYIDALRKPTHVVFCLDISGSMYGDGLKKLKEAMEYILDKAKASVDNLQFSDKDKVTVITFDNKVKDVFETKYGNELDSVIEFVSGLDAYGGTNIYSPSVEALKILEKDNKDEYTRTVILMTDGMSNAGSYSELSNYYKKHKLDIPIYSITFGESSEEELSRLAELSNGKVFDGKTGLLKAFSEVRSYN